jgi:16S rRNA U516 pseudouridylate synthase RsuA-like enzyme
MPVQAARLANLRSVIRLLEAEGLVTRQSQADYLDNAVTASRLQAMLDGSHIHTLFAEHVEHVLFKPRGWMSEAHDPETLDTAGDATRVTG